MKMQHALCALALSVSGVVACSDGTGFSESITDNTARANRGGESDVDGDGNGFSYARQPMVQCTEKDCEATLVAAAGMETTREQQIDSLTVGGQSQDSVAAVDIANTVTSLQQQADSQHKSGSTTRSSLTAASGGESDPESGTESLAVLAEDSGAPMTVATTDSCLDALGSHNFSFEGIAAAEANRIIWKNINNSVVFRDDVVTLEPVLNRIEIDAKNANKGLVFLSNPNGWYCLSIEAKNINNFRFVAHCDAKLAVVALAHNAHGIKVERIGCN